MTVELIGWDIGGAHLKAAALAGDRVVAVIQKPSPLWLGLSHFHQAAAAILRELSPSPGCRHAVTMTGELVDLFARREEGVFGLLQALQEQVPGQAVEVFAGELGFLPAKAVLGEHVGAIASVNWLATGYLAASRIEQGLLVDIGSTTADLLVLREGRVLARGFDDCERMRCDELVYTGVVRTSLMALAQQAPFRGEWVGLMAEHFATTADVYRLTRELPEYADQSPAADGGEKTLAASARRIARLLGCDLESAASEEWTCLAQYFRERQLARLMDACRRQLSRNLINCHAPVIGAGIGRFLVQELSTRIGQPYLDFVDLFPKHSLPPGFHIADCAPAVAVAYLARQNHD
ncbi:MAG: hydantoinase/oxoprolinase family protein [Methylococcaceae bacterium]|nr:hydantoinase/oxoprolinase family protein [Methylococcaceae bacterium]